jgi:hypothetical protein
MQWSVPSLIPSLARSAFERCSPIGVRASPAVWPSRVSHSRGRKSTSELRELLCRVKAEAKLWSSHLKIAQRGDVAILLAEADSIKRDLAHMDAACAGLQRQVRGLQDSRREMLAQMQGMVPRSELEGCQAEAAMLRGSVAGLQREAAAAQQERERLVSAMQVTACLAVWGCCCCFSTLLLQHAAASTRG